MVLGFLTSVLTLRNWCYSFITTKRQSKQNAPTVNRGVGTGGGGQEEQSPHHILVGIEAKPSHLKGLR